MGAPANAHHFSFDTLSSFFMWNSFWTLYERENQRVENPANVHYIERFLEETKGKMRKSKIQSRLSNITLSCWFSIHRCWYCTSRLKRKDYNEKSIYEYWIQGARWLLTQPLDNSSESLLLHYFSWGKKKNLRTNYRKNVKFWTDSQITVDNPIDSVFLFIEMADTHLFWYNSNFKLAFSFICCRQVQLLKLSIGCDYWKNRRVLIS